MLVVCVCYFSFSFSHLRSHVLEVSNNSKAPLTIKLKTELGSSLLSSPCCRSRGWEGKGRASSSSLIYQLSGSTTNLGGYVILRPTHPRLIISNAGEANLDLDSQAGP